jgi:hypothetical protein
MRLLRRIWLFVRIVWRESDSKEIPKLYRAGRIAASTAWQVARIVHP